MNDTRPAWNPGDELDSRTLSPITRSQLERYADASGDRNPIHTSDEAAEEAGLSGIIAHGMLTAATMSLLFSPYLKHGYVREFYARFSGMVYLGDELTVGGRTTGAKDTDEGCLYDFEVYTNRGEEGVASGTVGFLVYEDR